MTYKEEQKAIIRAKRWIHDVIYTHQDVLDGEEPDDTEKATFEECEVILKALEKQTPKKPDYEGDGYWNGELVYDTWICPNCGKDYEVDYDNYKYCPKCGQAIDLGGDEE